MTPELKNLLVTGSFIIVLLVLFIWLLRALIPSAEDRARQAARDEYEMSGYETMDTTRRKEFGVIALSAFVILLCLGVLGGLGYLLYTTDVSTLLAEEQGLNTILIFIPAIVLLTMIILASKRYIGHQEGVLKEYRQFKQKRERAIAEYEARRSGKDKEGGKPKVKKKEPGRGQARGVRKKGESGHDSSLKRARQQKKKK